MPTSFSSLDLCYHLLCSLVVGIEFQRLLVCADCLFLVTEIKTRLPHVIPGVP